MGLYFCGIVLQKYYSMQYSKLNFLFLGIFISLVTLTSCSDDDDATSPITLGSTVTVSNTFQGTAQTGGIETDIEDVFQVPAGSLAATASVDGTVEFPAYLLGLYDIDINENSISFELVAPADDPTYMNFFRILEAGTTDRYYLVFDEAQNVNGFTSDNASVSLRIDSNQILVVEIGEGFDFNPGSTFTITLN